MIKLLFSYYCVQYAAVISIIYLNDKIKVILCQLQVTKLSLRVIVNHLNQALFLRTEDGKLSYSNDIGIKII